jgi:TusA-related sulfurtransferase
MEEMNMNEVVIDCLGEACPVPLVKAQNKLNELAVGDVLIVQIDHSCAMKNVPEWARKDGHNVEVEEVDDGEWEVIIEKAK